MSRVEKVGGRDKVHPCSSLECIEWQYGRKAISKEIESFVCWGLGVLGIVISIPEFSLFEHFGLVGKTVSIKHCCITNLKKGYTI